MMVLWTSSQLSAQDFTVDGINYQILSETDKTCKVAPSQSVLVDEDVIIPATVTLNSAEYTVQAIGSMAFYGCTIMSSVKLPETITTIEESAFLSCVELTSIEIPSSVTTIGTNAFGVCSALKSIKFPNSPVNIGERAFNSCGFENLDLPEWLNSLPDEVFAECKSLVSVKLPASLTSIGKSAFAGCSSLTDINFPNGLSEIKDAAFDGCTSLSTLELPASLTSLGNRVFQSCASLFDVELPESITALGESVFERCANLGSVKFPSQLISIGYRAFNQCPSLLSVNLPESLTTIDSYAFENCESLEEVILPASITKIGWWAFNACDNVKIVECKSTTPGNIQGNAAAFPTTATLKVPAEAFNAYVATEPWSNLLTIESIEGEKVTLKEATAEVIAGNSVQLTATVTGGSGNTVTWTSDDESIATVDATGKVTGVAEGEVLIRATSNAARSTCTVSVKVIHAENIELNEIKYTLEKGKTLELKATITPAEHSDEVKWTSSNEEVATVDQNGVVTAVNKGFARITVTAGTAKAECDVNVVIPATAITLDETATIEKGKTLKLIAKVTPEDTTDDLIWRSDNEEVATVDKNGVVTAVNKGEANITLTAGNVSATCKVTVVIPATAITLDETATIEKGETLELKAKVTPEDTTDKLVWTSEDENVATVDENGVVTAVAVGTTKITVTAGKVSASCDVTVVISAKEIALDKDEATIEKGETLTLTPTVVPEDTTDKLVWTSEDENIATVNENGVVTAVAVGTTKITVTAGKVSAFCDVTVVISAKDITLDKTEANIEKGKTLELKATVNPEDTTDKLVWTSDDKNVATVDENGVVTAVAPGTAKITVTAGKVSASCDVTVVISMTGIELDKTEAEGYIGGTVQLTATVKPEDTTDDTTVTWKSSDEEVATVDENGLVSCLAEGEAVIIATCGEFSAECTVTVTDRPPFVAITSLELSESEIELALNFTYSLFAIIAPENATDTELEWSSSDINVARVYEGVVYGIVPGEAVITAKTTDGSNLSASCKVTIVETSGIDGTEGDGVKVTAAAGVVTVKGAAAGSTVEVYSMSGACVAAKTVESSVEEFPVAASGIYVVRAGGKTFKVAL